MRNNKIKVGDWVLFTRGGPILSTECIGEVTGIVAECLDVVVCGAVTSLHKASVREVRTRGK